MIDDKLYYTSLIFEEYERRFMEAKLNREFHIPTTDEDRAKIVADTKRMLGIKEKWIPKIGEMTEVRRDKFEKYDAIQLKYETWKNFYASGTLYMPHGEEDVPLMFIFCGHALTGRRTPAYAILASRFANLGMAVYVADNIGRGDRLKYGHWHTPEPFYCGTTMQGLIIMESLALVKKVIEFPRVDKTRVGAVGNSGGGTLSLLMAALCEDLVAVCPSGYPCEFSYIHAKEKDHCHCNLLPGCANGPEMWEVLASRAPKHLMVHTGQMDSLIPHDYFMRMARKIRHTYIQNGAEDKFCYCDTRTPHGWVAESRDAFVDYFGKLFLNKTAEDSPETEELLPYFEKWVIEHPEDGIKTSHLPEVLSGITMPKGMEIYDMFIPTYKGEPIKAEDVVPETMRGNTMTIFAQMECALKEWEE